MKEKWVLPPGSNFDHALNKIAFVLGYLRENKPVEAYLLLKIVEEHLAQGITELRS
jgi:hypothetical protein